MLHPDNTTCIPNANCSYIDGSFTCTCLIGYEDTSGTGFNCSGKKRMLVNTIVCCGKFLSSVKEVSFSSHY